MAMIFVGTGKQFSKIQRIDHWPQKYKPAAQIIFFFFYRKNMPTLNNMPLDLIVIAEALVAKGANALVQVQLLHILVLRANVRI
jgi:hypothetical protein